MNQTPNEKILIFSLIDRTCALPLSDVREVIALPKLIKPPGMPTLLEGYFDFGGEAVAVIHLSHLLGLPHFDPDLYSPLICLNGERFIYSVLVHRVVSLESVPSNSLEKIPVEDSLNGVEVGLVQSSLGPVPLLSISNLLLEKERRFIAEFSELRKKRIEVLS